MPLSWSRILSSPATLLAAGVVFIASAHMLPIGPTNSSQMGRKLARLNPFGPAFPTGPRVIPEYGTAWFRVLLDGRLQHVPDELLPSNLFKDPAYLKVFIAKPDFRTRGWWAPVTRYVSLRVECDAKALDETQRAELRKQYVALHAARDPYIAPYAADLALADVNTQSVIWSGWIHNAISLISFLILIASVPMVTTRLLRERRINKGLCPHCRYDRSGLTDDAPCPECGKTAQTAA